MRGIQKALKKARQNAIREIERNSPPRDGCYFGAALASEGFAGGYREALNDVELALRGYVNGSSRYWPRPEDRE